MKNLNNKISVIFTSELSPCLKENTLLLHHKYISVNVKFHGVYIDQWPSGFKHDEKEVLSLK